MKIAFHPDTRSRSGALSSGVDSNEKFESRRHPCAFRIRRAWGKGVEEAEPSREEARVDSARSRAEYRINSPCRDDKRTLPTPRYPMEDRGGGETTFGSDSRATVHDRVVVPRKFEQTRMDPSKAFRQICDRPGEGISLLPQSECTEGAKLGASSPLRERAKWMESNYLMMGLLEGYITVFFSPVQTFVAMKMMKMQRCLISFITTSYTNDLIL